MKIKVDFTWRPWMQFNEHKCSRARKITSYKYDDEGAARNK